MNSDTRSHPDIVIIAEQIHKELPDLLGTDATAVGPQLAGLIKAARTLPAGEEREQRLDDIYAVLARRKPTQQRMQQLLPREERGSEKGGNFQPFPGDSGVPVPVDRYVCPRCGYAWPVFDIDDPTPPPRTCPHDDVLLVLKLAGV